MKKVSKYIFSLIFSTGLLFSLVPKPTIVYNCTGQEMFPTFFGCPFIYKSSSLASSLEYDFYLLGIITNIIIWSLLILLLRLVLVKIFSRINNKFLRYTYKISKYGLAILCIAWTILFFYVSYSSLKFQADINGEAKAWGMTCNGQLYLTD